MIRQFLPKYYLWAASKIFSKDSKERFSERSRLALYDDNPIKRSTLANKHHFVNKGNVTTHQKKKFD